MKVSRRDGQSIALEEIDSVIADLLERIPKSADPNDSEAAAARIFPSLTGDRDPEAEAEWVEYVKPDLQALFQGHLERVQADLKTMSPAEIGLRELVVPVAHLEAWIHALKQARLALAARHAFTDEELESDTPLEGGPRAYTLFQIRFYGLLQEFFLQQLD